MSHMEARSGPYQYVKVELCKEMPFYIDMAGFDQCAPHYRVRSNASSISVVGFTMKGRGVVRKNGKTAEAEEGSLFLVNTGDFQEYFPISDWEFCWVNIEGDYWRELLTKYGLDREIIYYDFELGQEFINLVRDITNNNADMDKWQIEIQGFLYKMVLHLYKVQRTMQDQTMGVKIKTEFEKYMKKGMSQEEICKKIGISVRHAQRVFKQEFGMSIHQFLSELKIQQAKASLANTNCSVKQIAEKMGFENEKYFSTFFRKSEGVSPTQYRRCKRK